MRKHTTESIKSDFHDEKPDVVIVIIGWDVRGSKEELLSSFGNRKHLAVSKRYSVNRACVLLEQQIERELLLFACRNHIDELVLKVHWKQ